MRHCVRIRLGMVEVRENTVGGSVGPVQANQYRKATRGLRRYIGSYLLVAPSLVLLCVLVVYPLADAFYLSFTDASFIRPIPEWVGVRNYHDAVVSDTFWKVFTNSILWTVLVVVCQFLLGLATGVLLAQKLRIRSVVRALVIVPWVMPGVIAAILWKLMYDPYLGLVNKILMTVHLADGFVAWLAQPETSLPAIIVAAIWKGTPFSTLMYLAAYQNVPADLLDAARIDGASRWQRFIYVAFPEMLPTIRTTILLTTIWTFNYFDLVYVMTRGGPGYASHIFPTYTYELAFAKALQGEAAAYGMIGTAIMLIFSILYIREINRRGGLD
jgi:multiple sugar transport system permease protein